MESMSDEFSLILWMLARLAIFSMLLERALYFVFDYRLWREELVGKGIRAPVSFLAAWGACFYWDFDAVYPVLDPSAGSTTFGVVITAAIIAGGSQGAMILFQDVLNFSRKSRENFKKIKDERHSTELKKLKIEGVRIENELKKLNN